MIERVDDWRVQETANQTIFREMNEWIEEDRDGREGSARLGFDTYICECGDAACSEPILLTRNEYESVRSVGVRFAIALDHENPEIDLLVGEYPRFAVVDKVFGETTLVARRTNPRRQRLA
jgi:hypothetical protein